MVLEEQSPFIAILQDVGLRKVPTKVCHIWYDPEGSSMLANIYIFVVLNNAANVQPMDNI